MNNKNLLAILGSPHVNGTTAAMLEYAIQRAEEKGYTVNKINLYEKNIFYCTGCRSCINTQTCIQKDDIQEIASLLHKCHTVLLAAPVYWANVPAPVKNLFDRLLGTAMEETGTFPRPRLKGKKYMILTSCNTPAPFSWIFGQSRGTVHSMDEFFKTAGMKPIGKIVCAGPVGRNELAKRAAGREQPEQGAGREQPERAAGREKSERAAGRELPEQIMRKIDRCLK